MSIPAWLSADPRVAHTRRLPATAGATAPWPTWVDPRVVETCAELGIDRPWTHQAEAAEAAFAGHHVAVATPTASGKSLAYLLPILAATLSGAGGRPPLARAGGVRLTGRATARDLATVPVATEVSAA